MGTSFAIRFGPWGRGWGGGGEMFACARVKSTHFGSLGNLRRASRFEGIFGEASGRFMQFVKSLSLSSKSKTIATSAPSSSELRVPGLHGENNSNSTLGSRFSRQASNTLSGTGIHDLGAARSTTYASIDFGVRFGNPPVLCESPKAAIELAVPSPHHASLEPFLEAEERERDEGRATLQVRLTPLSNGAHNRSMSALQLRGTVNQSYV